MTPLQFSCKTGCTGVIEYFLQNRDRLRMLANRLNNNLCCIQDIQAIVYKYTRNLSVGETQCKFSCLMLALENEHFNIVKLILNTVCDKNGESIDVFYCNQHGISVFDIAIRKRHCLALQLLCDYVILNTKTYPNAQIIAKRFVEMDICEKARATQDEEIIQIVKNFDSIRWIIKLRKRL